MQFCLPCRYFGRQYDAIIVFRLSIGLKIGNFLFWSYEPEILQRGAFLNRKFDFLIKTIETNQFNVKNHDFLGTFKAFHLSILCKSG